MKRVILAFAAALACTAIFSQRPDTVLSEVFPQRPDTVQSDSVAPGGGFAESELPEFDKKIKKSLNFKPNIMKIMYGQEV